MSNEIVHTEQCLANTKAEDEWRAKWPNHCKTCGAWGVQVTPGCSVPYGSTSAQLPDDVDPCPDCEEKNLCPRCGTERVWHDDDNADNGFDGYHDDCPNCGLHCPACYEPTPENEGLIVAECYCWEDQGEQIYD